MDWDKIFQRLAIIIPAIHIMTCGIYIIGYSVGFRNQIGSLFSVSDFVTITFNHLVMLYASSIVVPTVMTLIRHRSGATYASDLIESTPAGEDRERAILNLESRRRLLRLFLIFMFISSAIAILINIAFAGKPIYQIMLVMLMLSLTALFYIEASRQNLYGIKAELAWIMAVFFVAVFGFAVDQGIRDRRLPFKELGTSYYYCNDLKILSPIGDLYIAAAPNEERLIVDKECKRIFKFPKTDPLFKGSLWDAVKSRFEP